jgi:hypothetical protein
VLQEVAIPKNAVAGASSVRITATFDLDGSAGNKSVQFRMGGTPFGGAGYTSGAGDVGVVSFEITVFIDGSGTVQYRQLTGGPLHVQPFVNTGPAVDTTAPQTLQFTGECANAADTITLTDSLVEIVRAQ